MKVVGEFVNEFGETFKIGKKTNKYYFSSDDFLFHGKYWRNIDLGKHIFSDEEVLLMNNIIRNDLMKGNNV